MNPKTAAVLALFVLVGLLTLRDVLASQPPRSKSKRQPKPRS